MSSPTQPDAITPAIGIYIIGDEILSGKREDGHFRKAQEILGARGLALSWASYLGDDIDHCIESFRMSMARPDLVFSFGGIGATPDDHTRQAAAAALGRPLVPHPEAQSLIAQRCDESGQPLTPERLRMGEFPQGAQIIPNPYNRIPGFSVDRHYFLPGFPVMAWPMMEWVLDTHYSGLFREVAEIDHSIRVLGLFEATVTPLLEQLTAQYPNLSIYSLPTAPPKGEGGPKRLLELGIKRSGRRHQSLNQDQLVAQIDEAFEALQAGVRALGGEIAEVSQVRR